MKRPVLHVVFWFVYLVQDTLLHFTWMGPSLKNIPDQVQFGMAVKTAIVLLPVKFLLVYYFTGVGVKKILDDSKNKVLVFLETGLLFAVSVILFRASFYYFIYPEIYLSPNTVTLLNARAVFISILEMGYIGGAAIAAKLFRLQARAKDKEKNLVKEKLETELKFLRNQTNPHFLFNTLNNIYGLARRKSDKTSEAIMKLSELLSFMIYETRKDVIAISDEIKMIEDYISLERIRYTDRLSITINKDIDNHSQPVAPLLLLPLVENAFKHGVSETRFNSFIDISIRLKENRLTFCIENTFENFQNKTGNGSIGLSSTKRQLELMYKDHELLIDNNQEKTFKVKITVNLSSYGKV
jgi:two-component system, LytTR family, sensor kinase